MVRPMNEGQTVGCQACAGATYVLDEETGQARPCKCRDQAIKRAKTRRLLTSLPRYYLDSGVALDRRPVIDLAPKLRREIKSYARNLASNIDEGRGLWVAGPPGTGKTAAAGGPPPRAPAERLSPRLPPGPEAPSPRR